MPTGYLTSQMAMAPPFAMMPGQGTLCTQTGVHHGRAKERHPKLTGQFGVSTYKILFYTGVENLSIH